MWLCVHEVNGHSKQKHSPVNDSVFLDTINNFFQMVAISPSNKSADEFCPVSHSSDSFALVRFPCLQL